MTHMNRTPDKDMPAAQLMHAAQPALTEQQTLLEEQRAVWRQRAPAAADRMTDDAYIEPTVGLESRSIRAPQDSAIPIGPHTLAT